MLPVSLATATSAGSSQVWLQFAPFVLIIVVFYFLLIRPQQKRQKEASQMRDALKRGDRVVTQGGILGTIKKVSGEELVIELSDGVQVQLLKEFVMSKTDRPALKKTASRRPAAKKLEPQNLVPPPNAPVTRRIWQMRAKVNGANGLALF